jgi:hypothetical protein
MLVVNCVKTVSLNVPLTLWDVHYSHSDTRDKVTNKVFVPVIVREPLNYWNQVLQKVDELPFSVAISNSF